MAVELHAYALTTEGKIPVKHIFYGETEAEADRGFAEHVKACPFFGPAEKDDRIISFYLFVDRLPTEKSANAEAEAADDLEKTENELESDGEEEGRE